MARKLVKTHSIGVSMNKKGNSNLGFLILFLIINPLVILGFQNCSFINASSKLFARSQAKIALNTNTLHICYDSKVASCIEP